jgi:hypothetical protein
MRLVSGLILIVLVIGSAGYAVAQWDCEDEIYAVVEEDCITVHHIGALYNCCPTRFDYDITLEEPLITVVETENLEGGGCWCVCCMDLAIGIDAVPPGEYTLEFRWFDYEGQEWLSVLLDVIVEDWGQVSDLHLAWSDYSDCYGTTDTGDEDPPAFSWGMVKLMFK